MKITYTGQISFKLRKKINSVLNYARKFLNQPRRLEIEISFVGQDEIKRLNGLNRGIDKVTDVLSFPMLQLEQGKSINMDDYSDEIVNNYLLLGSIAICSERALEQSIEYGHSIEREICFLSLHGFLHLLGYDHIEKEDEEIMQSVAELILLRKKIVR